MAAAVILGWWLARLLQDEEETEEAVWTPPQRPPEVEIPLPLQDDAADDPAAEQDDPAAEQGKPAAEQGKPAARPRQAAKADTAEEPADFTRIDGIGPKYAEGLIASGITSFRQLSEQDPERLAELLRARGLRIIGDRILQNDWIGQARRLAAEG
jgi:predicted flap endonuclease-1-like 5' DNA nuclease